MVSKSTLNTEKPINYIHYIILPLKIVACWDWYPNPKRNREIFINNVYLGLVLFVLVNMPAALAVHLYTEWQDIMSSLDKIADCLPLLVSVAIVSYYAIYRQELYDLLEYMGKNFKHHSAKGLSNMSMTQSYNKARWFGSIYTACTMFSVSMYATLPVIIHLWTKEPIQNWIYTDVSGAGSPILVLIFLRSCLAQLFVGLAMGQFGVFFASNSILICGQLDLLCCSLRNVRYTALLRHGVRHEVLRAAQVDVTPHELHNYIYNVAETNNSEYHYDKKVGIKSSTKSSYGVFFASNSILICGQLDLLCCSLRNVRYTALLRHGVRHEVLRAAQVDVTPHELHNYIYNVAETNNSEYHYDKKVGIKSSTKSSYDMYSPAFDDATVEALCDCARLCQIIKQYKDMFERFVSPLLVLRVVQVTLYLCTLLYAATLKFDMITVEYLAAVALDIFVYCYYGNQIIIQADRVSTAAYQSAWHTMGVKPRRMLLNMLLANRRPVVVRAGRFLPMDLHTFVVIIKTSFSYYTLLVNVNEK